MKIAEAARWINRPKTTLYGAVNDGRLRKGDDGMVDVADVERLWPPDAPKDMRSIPRGAKAALGIPIPPQGLDPDDDLEGAPLATLAQIVENPDSWVAKADIYEAKRMKEAALAAGAALAYVTSTREWIKVDQVRTELRQQFATLRAALIAIAGAAAPEANPNNPTQAERAFFRQLNLVLGELSEVSLVDGAEAAARGGTNKGGRPTQAQRLRAAH